jgi:hypothetical protein
LYRIHIIAVEFFKKGIKNFEVFGNFEIGFVLCRLGLKMIADKKDSE